MHFNELSTKTLSLFIICLQTIFIITNEVGLRYNRQTSISKEIIVDTVLRKTN